MASTFKIAGEITIQAFKEGLKRTSLNTLVFEVVGTDTPFLKDGIPVKVEVIKPHLIGVPYRVHFTVSKNIFDRLTEDQVKYVVDKAWAYVVTKNEEGDLKRESPSFVEFRGILVNYPFETIEANLMALEDMKQEEIERIKDEKALAKGKGKKKK